ncbi:MAG: T9SS type A sorting domain-containing protein [Ferruginibacter sp.]|nr:T9SS type A sorting domain-containing protein [Ferruginibacter sp.]
MKSFLPAVIFLFSLVVNAGAQSICGTTAYKQQMVKSDPSLIEVFRNIEEQIAAENNKTNGNFAMRDTTANEIIYIPVVIHLLYKKAAENISDAQIKSQLDVLNADFSMLNSDQANTPSAFKSLAGNARIQFCLARVDPQGHKTTGIDRKYTSQDLFTTNDEMKMADKGGAASWNSKHYLNIWVCRLSSRSLGYATPPGAAADKDGVVIAYDVFGTTGNLRAPFNKGRTATHEVGHWLGLIHMWGDTNCGDDHVDDTPKQQSYNFGCQNFPKLSNCSPDSNGDMFMNFMDFSDDACMNLFTRGQVKRMRALFAQNNIRNSFLASFACDSTLAVGGPLPTTVTHDVVQPAVPVAAAIKIYPSPVNTVTTIECKGATALTIKTLSIFNSLGMKVFTARLNQEKTRIDLTNLTRGIYIVHIGDGKDKFTTRIIKQ